MSSRLHKILFLVFLLILIRLFLLTLSPRKATKQPHVHPPPTPLPKGGFQQRLIAIGDLHGDLEHAQRVLRFTKLIDADANWVGGKDILVQTGDIVDRGTWALDIYEMMARLRAQAAGEGGRVVSILGNHEVMNAIGDWRYVTQGDIQRFGGTAKRQAMLSKDGWLGQEWLANYSSTALVAISPHASSPLYSFTHGSLRPSFPNLLPYPSAINALGHSLLQKALTPPLALPYPPNPYSGLPEGTTPEEADLYGGGGPYWWRGLAETQDEDTVCGWAQELQAKLGVRRIVGGHTPDFEKIVHRCNASVIIIDTGISSAYGGVLSALEILYTLTPLDPPNDHHQDPLLPPEPNSAADSEMVEFVRYRQYHEEEVVQAVYERHKVLLRTESRIIHG